MGIDRLFIHGVILRGHQVASRPSKDYPYPALTKQKPFFKERGLDLDQFFLGTLNISIAPLRFEIFRPEITFPFVPWTDLHPPETFSFSPCIIFFKNRKYPGLIYYPHPETKIRHFQDPSLIEVLAEHIPGIGYGDEVELAVDPDQVRIQEE